jgi:hypothetical protein
MLREKIRVNDSCCVLKTNSVSFTYTKSIKLFLLKKIKPAYLCLAEKKNAASVNSAENISGKAHAFKSSLSKSLQFGYKKVAGSVEFYMYLTYYCYPIASIEKVTLAEPPRYIGRK